MAASSIENALANGENADQAVDRETLRYAVMRQIFCPRSGGILDVRTAVYFRLTIPTNSVAECITGATWDAIGPDVRRLCAEKGVDLEVIDGRTLSLAARAAARIASVNHDATCLEEL